MLYWYIYIWYISTWFLMYLNVIITYRTIAIANYIYITYMFEKNISPYVSVCSFTGPRCRHGTLRIFFSLQNFCLEEEWNHQEFQVPKMEVLNLIRLFWGWVFPYISLTYSLYIGEYLHLVIPSLRFFNVFFNRQVLADMRRDAAARSSDPTEVGDDYG